MQLSSGLVLAVEVRDPQEKIYNVPVEFVGEVPGVAGLTQIVIRVPDGIESAGDLTIRIIARGKTSNQVFVIVK